MKKWTEVIPIDIVQYITLFIASSSHFESHLIRDYGLVSELLLFTLGVDESVMQLLMYGSHMGIKNDIGETPVNTIFPATLESFFDSCVQLNGRARISWDFAITFQYSYLTPTQRTLSGETTLDSTTRRSYDGIAIQEEPEPNGN